MRVSRELRLFIGVFNTLAAATIAAYGSAFPFSFIRKPEIGFHLTTSWAAVAAAAVATIAIAFDLAIVGWIALGYLVWIGLLAGHALSLIFLALAVSLSPVLPRPAGSLLAGIGVAAITALSIGFLRGLGLIPALVFIR